MYICQKCLVACIFNSKIEFTVINTSNTGIFTSTFFCPLAKIHPKMSKIHKFYAIISNILFKIVINCQPVDVIMPVFVCIFGSISLYDCIIGRGLYLLTNIHSYVFLPVVKMPRTSTSIISKILRKIKSKL